MILRKPRKENDSLWLMPLRWQCCAGGCGTLPDFLVKNGEGLVIEENGMGNVFNFLFVSSDHHLCLLYGGGEMVYIMELHQSQFVFVVAVFVPHTSLPNDHKVVFVLKEQLGKSAVAIGRGYYRILHGCRRLDVAFNAGPSITKEWGILLDVERPKIISHGLDTFSWSWCHLRDYGDGGGPARRNIFARQRKTCMLPGNGADS